MDNLFPFDTVRPVQEEMMEIVASCVRDRAHAVLHAPTGLGKTVASLAPALAYAIENGKTVFFLTSRHTQHRIAVDTLKAIRDRHGTNVIAADIIGKQALCPVPNVHTVPSGEFADYCRTVREDRTCSFFSQARSKGSLSPKGLAVAEEVMKHGPMHAEEVVSRCSTEGLCPYEILMHVAQEAKVIIADYYYVFNRNILDLLLGRIGKKLSDVIIIIDEGHNLGGRIRELRTSRLSSLALKRASKEAAKFGIPDLIPDLDRLGEALYDISQGLDLDGERLVEKARFMDLVGDGYDSLIERLEDAGDTVKKEQKRSSLSGVSQFLAAWTGPEEGQVRIIAKKASQRDVYPTLSYRCLDPSIISGEIIAGSHAVILMSGTLTPTSMYKEILGFPEDAIEKEFPSPFPIRNRLTLIVPKTTTKFQSRSPEQFRMIAALSAGITNTIPGNVAVFFPSYSLRDQVMRTFEKLSEKTLFQEIPGMSKEDKQEMLERFKSYMKTGAVLAGVASGSFGEGIDLPGDLLRGVLVVGLPLQVPDLETKELISYYDRKFGKGWDYGYVLPAITKTMQNAGRCIRSETDKGVIVFLEERYAWPRYQGCFPKEWNIKVTTDFQNQIKDFFSRP